MGDVTITRGKGFTEDFLTSSQYTIINTSHAVGTITSDGDYGTLSVVFTSAVSGDNSTAQAVLPLISTTTYPKLKVRHSDSGIGTNPQAKLQILYSGGTSDTFVLAASSNMIVETFTLTPGKTLSLANVILAATASFSGTFSLTVDFYFVFKETLTLPGIIQPMPVSAGRIIAVLPILQRDGEILQDLGSKSPELIIQGALVSTTTPTNHTAAEWWDLLEGLVLEGANETWQWVTSDRVNYKYLPIDLSRSEILNRKNYYEFTLRLKRFDVLSQTTDRLGIVY